MIYPVALLLMIVVVALLVLGSVLGKTWALYFLKGLWIVLIAIAGHFTFEACKGSIYSENWEMLGVIFIVWPITGFVCLATVVELVLIRKGRDIHSRINRVIALLTAGFLMVLSVLPAVFSAS